MTAANYILPLIGLAVLVVVMFVGWLVQRRTRNAGIVDLLWTIGMGVLAVTYAVFATGWMPRRILIALLAGIWAVRLALHLAQRIQNEREDGRYAALRTKLGARFDATILWLFLAQAPLAVSLSSAYLVPSAAEEVGFGARDVAAVMVWLIALTGESTADRQLSKWRADASNAGRTCRAGLWRYSRHPNYFFEWLHWFAYPIASIGLPLGWIPWLAPLAMYLLITKLTGVPPTEKQALKSRGDDYREYQRTTNAFFPGIPRRNPKPNQGARSVSICA